jgi:hypothetical protein
MTDERWRALKQKAVALLGGDQSANLPTYDPERRYTAADGITPALTVLHLHLHASEYRARRTQRLTDKLQSGGVLTASTTDLTSKRYDGGQLTAPTSTNSVAEIRRQRRRSNFRV